MASGAGENQAQGSVWRRKSSKEEKKKTLQDVLTNFQAIYQAIRNLDQKLDILNWKVSKMQRSWAKSSRHLHRSRASSRRSDDDIPVKKSRKRKKRERRDSLSHSENYSPTSPVRRPDHDAESNFTVASLSSEVFREVEPDPPVLRDSPSFPYFTSCSYQEHFTPSYGLPGSPTLFHVATPEMRSGSSSPTFAGASAAASPASPLRELLSPRLGPEDDEVV